MPVVRPPDGGPAIKLPRCPDCGKAMRLESSDPNTHYANLDQLKFVCGSGQTTLPTRPPSAGRLFFTSILGPSVLLSSFPSSSNTLAAPMCILASPTGYLGLRQLVQ